MNRKPAAHLSPVRIFAAGLLVSQAFFTVFVYQSNLDLLKRLEAVCEAGYQPVPNASVMAVLPDFLPALCGGLFFTLTVGAALSLGGFAAAWLFFAPGRRQPILLLFLLIFWETAAAFALETGHPFTVGAVFLMVPPLAGGLCLAWQNFGGCRSPVRFGLLHLGTLFLIGILWLPNFSGRVFIDIRDRLLLGNCLGSGINEFYYAYTLYPAEAFKALHQKQIRTCRVEASDEGVSSRLAKTLRSMDYLPVPNRDAVDLTLAEQDGQLDFRSRGRSVLQTSTARFFASPKTVLKKFSQASDRAGFLRRFTFISLIIASPILLYALLYALVSHGLLLFGVKRNNQAAAALLCVGLAAAAALPLYRSGAAAAEASAREKAASLLASENRWERIAALRELAPGDRNLKPFQEKILPLRKSPHPAERYWAAKTLGGLRTGKADQALSGMLSDPHFNVVCAALYSLGRRRDPAAIPDIFAVLSSSKRWYVQLYAYNALKELGWTQPGSD
jgi:hypothetical protein